MSIKKKLLLIAAISLLSLVSIGLIVYTQSKTTEQHYLNEIELVNIQSEMLLLRRYEKNFINRNDYKYIQRFNNAVTNANVNISDLIERLNESDVDSRLL